MDLKYIVEFIEVKQNPAALNAYRDTMATAIGPALAEVVRRGIFDSMLALETVSVHAVAAGVPNWNQIHIRAVGPDDERNVELIDKIMDGVMNKVSPQSGGVERVFERLVSLRSIVREDVAEELVELNVGKFVPPPS